MAQATAERTTWQKDVDAAIEQARAAKRPVLLDFTAAPA